jgi:hypothetical protein
MTSATLITFFNDFIHNCILFQVTIISHPSYHFNLCNIDLNCWLLISQNSVLYNIVGFINVRWNFPLSLNLLFYHRLHLKIRYALFISSPLCCNFVSLAKHAFYIFCFICTCTKVICFKVCLHISIFTFILSAKKENAEWCSLLDLFTSYGTYTLILLASKIFLVSCEYVLLLKTRFIQRNSKIMDSQHYVIY